MNNGINTKTLVAEQELTILVNKLIQNGLPPVVLQMILVNTANKMNSVCQQAIEEEKIVEGDKEIHEKGEVND